jgi:phospholipid/cholesterol/gamma-HCH transport system substrate-binding protein
LVELVINQNVKLPGRRHRFRPDKGLIGEKIYSDQSGGSDKIIAAGGKIRETESAIDIEEVISKYAFGTGAIGRNTCTHTKV